MRTEPVVEAPPALRDAPSFSECVEDLAIEQLVPKPGVDGVDGPRTSAGCAIIAAGAFNSTGAVQWISR